MCSVIHMLGSFAQRYEWINLTLANKELFLD